MDRLRSGGCGAAVSKGGRLSRDTDVHRLDAERVGQEADCQRSCGRLVYECRGPLTFNGTPGNLANSESKVICNIRGRTSFSIATPYTSGWVTPRGSWPTSRHVAHPCDRHWGSGKLEGVICS